MSWEDRDYYRDDGRGGARFGGRLAGTSVVTWLLVINAVVFILDMILSNGMRVPRWVSPYQMGNFNVAQGVYGLQVWRFFTYMFLHGGVMHIVFNMLGLYFFGPLLEGWWGSKRFIAFYLLSGMAGAVLFTLIVLLIPQAIIASEMAAYAPQVPMIGASGAIFAILVGAAVLYPRQQVMLIFPPIPMTMRTMALVFLGIAFLSLLVGTPNAGGELAHLGGAALGFLLVKKPRLLDWADRFSPSAIQNNVNKGRWERKQKQKLEQDQELDRILAKVKEHGLQSLSRKEKKVLQQATDEKRRAG